jgi:phage gpG-like protein
MNVDFSVDTLGVREALSAMQSRMSDFTPLLYDIGVYMLRSIDLNFLEQGRPDPWKQSKAAIDRQGMTLMDTGRLRASVSIMGDPNNIFETSPNALRMSTDIPYAKYLHEERPFFVVQEEDVSIMEQMTVAYLRGE